MGQTGAMPSGYEYPKPTTSSGASNGGGGAGALAGMSAISSITNAYTQFSALKAKGAYDQSVADTNAKIANVEAGQVIEAGDIAGARKNSTTQQTVGAIRAVQAGSGTDVRSGSNALVRASAGTAGAIDELTIRNNAARQAWGFKTQAIMDSYQGHFARMTASNEAQQTLLQGGMQAVEGPMTMYANYMRFSRYMGGTGGPNGQPFDLSTK